MRLNGLLSKSLNYRLDEAFDVLFNADEYSQDEKSRARISAFAEYVAYRYAQFIRYVMLQIRLLLWFVLYGFGCLVLCVMTYPFQSRHLLGALLTVTFLLLTAAVAKILVQMDKDPILSRLEHSDVGKVTYASVAKNFLNIGGVPLVAVLASQFPTVGHALLFWVKPILSSAR
jgi:hypothetical protein